MILQEEEEKKPLAPKSGDAAIPIPKASMKASPRREYYYTYAYDNQLLSLINITHILCSMSFDLCGY